MDHRCQRFSEHEYSPTDRLPIRAWQTVDVSVDSHTRNHFELTDCFIDKVAAGQRRLSCLREFARLNLHKVTPPAEQKELYAQWFVKVEDIIKELLKAVGIVVSADWDPVLKTHSYHENLLKELRLPNNPYNSVLGKGELHESLREAKWIRNTVRGKNSGDDKSSLSTRWSFLLHSISRVEGALGIATGIMVSESEHIKLNENIVIFEDRLKQIQTQHQRLQANRQEFAIDIAAAVKQRDIHAKQRQQEVDQIKVEQRRLEAIEQRAATDMAAVRKRRETHVMFLKHEIAAVQKAKELKMEELRAVIHRERAVMLETRAKNAAIETEREVARQQQLDDRAVKLSKAEIQLQEDRLWFKKDQEAHKAYVTAFDGRMATEQAKSGQKKEHEVLCRISRHDELRTENEELKRSLQKKNAGFHELSQKENDRLKHLLQKENAEFEHLLQKKEESNQSLQNEIEELKLLLQMENKGSKRQLAQCVSEAKHELDYDTLCTMIVHHQKKRSVDPTLNTAMEDEENLPALITGLMANHVHSEKRAKFAEDQRKILQHDIEDLQRRLTAAEALQESEHDRVISLVSSMTNCSNRSHHLLAKLIGKQTLRNVKIEPWGRLFSVRHERVEDLALSEVRMQRNEESTNKEA